jgi:hypothetical protein
MGNIFTTCCGPRKPAAPGEAHAKPEAAAKAAAPAAAAPARAAAPAAASSGEFDDDVTFDPALLPQDGEALRAEAHAAGDAMGAAMAASKASYADGDGAAAKAHSAEAATHRAEAAAKNEAAARVIFAQKNAKLGLWEIDLHLLLVQEALDRTKRRLATAAAAAPAEGKDLSIIYGQGHHSFDGVAKIKPAILAMLQEGGYDARPDVPNEGASVRTALRSAARCGVRAPHDARRGSGRGCCRGSDSSEAGAGAAPECSGRGPPASDVRSRP